MELNRNSNPHFLPRAGQSSFILTSHSMDECEYLCNRIAIMASGRISCLGTYSQLRDKYAQGFKLQVKLRFERLMDKEYTNSVSERILATFERTLLKEFHLNTMIFLIEDNNLAWSELFHRMEQLFERLQLLDYSFSETTLEQVFLSFAQPERKHLKAE